MPITDTGIDVQMIIVDLKSRRNRKMIAITSRPPSMACSCTLPMARSMNRDWSSRTCSLMPSTSPLIRSTSRFTPSAIWMVLVPDCLVTCMRMPLTPLMRMNERRSSVVSRDVGDVAHVDRHALAGHHDDVPDFLDVGELAGAAQQQRAVGVVDFAERNVLVLGAQDLDDAIGRQVERGDLLARQVDVDLAAQAAVDRHRGDAGDALEARRQVVLRQLAQRHRIEVAFDADAHDRHRGGVELEHRRRVGVFRQAAADAIEAGAHFVGRFAEVGAPREVEADVGIAFRRGRVDALEAGDGADRLLDRPRDQLLHLERADARVVDADRDGRHLRVGHQVDRQARQRNAAQQDDDHADHEHRDGPFDGYTRNAHRLTLESLQVES